MEQAAMTKDLGFGTLCNNCCIMCTSIVPADPRNQPTTERLMREIDALFKNQDALTITGGEPTIRQDFFTILRYINKKHPLKKIHLITNARMCVYDPFIKDLKNIKNLRISTELHASSAELHDAITLTQGSFRQAYQGIKNLLEAGLAVEFRIVVSRINYQDVPALAALVTKEFPSVEEVVIFPIDIVGNAFRNKEKLIVTFAEFIPFVESAVDAITKRSFKVRLYHIPYCVIHEEYHPLIEGLTVPERRVTFAEVCTGCRFEKTCPRVWKSYAKFVGMGEFGPIMEKNLNNRSIS